ncbi:MAG TPA: DUF6282 family protein, partial [Dehalococcoidia bacterium]|nr:DUF6282 family protein [Dehalococcoidia bacterium]
PPEVPGVQGAIDTHCHAHAGQQDALAVAKQASRNGMGGILFKTIAGEGTPSDSVRSVQEELDRYCEGEKIAPTRLWSAYGIGRGWSEISYKAVEEHLDDGCSAVWMPVFTHANTLMTVATRSYEPGHVANAAPIRERPLHPPLSMEEAKRAGHYLLDDHGKLLPEIVDVIHIVADHDAVLSFGHVSRQEQWMITDELKKYGHKKAFIDHPFSPFIGLSVDEMKQFAAAGVKLNFTWDELSPLLGIDPMDMFGAIAEVGAEHCMLASDAGEPLFPDSIECLRLMRAYAEAFGMTPEDVYKLSCANAAELLGVQVKEPIGVK